MVSLRRPVRRVTSKKRSSPIRILRSRTRNHSPKAKQDQVYPWTLAPALLGLTTDPSLTEDTHCLLFPWTNRQKKEETDSHGSTSTSLTRSITPLIPVSRCLLPWHTKRPPCLPQHHHHHRRLPHRHRRPCFLDLSRLCPLFSKTTLVSLLRHHHHHHLIPNPTRLEARSPRPAGRSYRPAYLSHLNSLKGAEQTFIRAHNPTRALRRGAPIEQPLRQQEQAAAARPQVRHRPVQ